MEYRDFDIQIEPAGDKYRVRVLNSPGGQASGEFALPFSELELENFLLRMGQSRRRSRRLESPQTQAAKTVGGQLFNALFAGEVRSALSSSLNEVRRQDAGLRIRLRFSDAPELADLPWEYLYNASVNRFFSLSKETPIIRFLELSEPIRPLAVEPPLRILAMISSPSDYPALDVEREWSQLHQALDDLGRSGLATIERLDQASMGALQQRLRDGTYHIFHFVGHGGFDEAAQDGVLLLEDSTGRGRPVSGQDLGTLLYDHKSLRMAVLNACEGARASRTDPFAGTAQSLVQQGIPAVIAMQFEISDESAIVFAHEFYDMLARTYPVDAALGEARRAMFARNSELEWGTPVLYMRSTDGRIFDLATGAAGTASRRFSSPPTQAEIDSVQVQRVAQPRTPTTSQTPTPLQRQPTTQAQAQRLAQIYTQALAAFYTEQWDQAIGLLTEIVSEQSDYEDAAAKLEDAIRQRTVIEHYAAAIRDRESRDWAAAVEHLESLMALDPGYRDVKALLDEAQHQHVLAELYSEAQLLCKAGQWRATVGVFERISDLDAAYPDPDGLRASAQENLEVVERERKLATLYAAGLRHMDNGLWTEAIACFEQIQQVAVDYEATSSLLVHARESLKEHQAADEQVARSVESRTAEAQRQQRLAELFAEGMAHFRTHRWGDAIRALRELVAFDPAYADPTGGSAADLLTAALHQRELAALPSLPGERIHRPKPKDLPR